MRAHLFRSLAVILRQRMCTGYCFTTENGPFNVFNRLLHHDAVADNNDIATRQTAMGCMLALSEGALLAFISDESVCQ